MQQTSNERRLTAAETPDEIGEAGFGPTPATDGYVVKSGATVAAGDVQPGGAMGWRGTKAFLSKVVPWPVDGAGYVNLHYSMVNENGGKDIVTGKPFTNVDNLLDFAEWAKRKSNFKEMWYCTSLQSEAGTTKAGKPKAIRSKRNAKLLKSIWIDIDVKDDTKHYCSIEEAWSAFVTFRKTTLLPPPSAVVKSGGGLHIYWYSDKALAPAEWARYAHGLRKLLIKSGLKCDAGLTTDSARLLRLPNTLNYKYNPPRPVELLPLPSVVYDFASSGLGFLPDTGEVEETNAFAGKAPFFTGAADKLSDGIEREPMPLLPVAPIQAGCAFIREAIETGGKDYSQPEWNLTTLIATFLEDGHALAHRMGAGHEGYSAESTDALWERKNRERADLGLGWPSCKTIQANGCNACETCPFFAAGKSPLHLGLSRPPASISAKQVAVPDVKFRDVDKFGNKKPTLANAVIAIRALGIEARFDLFHRRVNVT
jgi:hypothetical protein